MPPKKAATKKPAPVTDIPNLTEGDLKPPSDLSLTVIQMIVWMGVGALLALLAVFGLGGHTHTNTKAEQGVLASLEEVHEALANNDIQHIEEHTNLPALTNQVVETVFLEGFEETGAGLKEVVAPTLAHSLEQEIKETMKAKAANNLGAEGHPPVTLLQKLYTDIAGQAGITVERTRLISLAPTGDSAVAVATLTRQDAGLSVNLPLRMQKQNGRWQITGLPGLANILEQLKTQENLLVTARNNDIAHRIHQTLQVVAIQKSAGMGADGKGKATLLTIGFKNNGTEAISGFTAIAALTEPQTGSTRTFEITATEPIAPNAVLEKTWPFPLDPLVDVDKVIYATPPANLTIIVRPTSLVFEDGTSLAPLALQ